MDRKFRPQLPITGLFGLIFTPIGLTFTIIGLVSAAKIRNHTANIQGDPNVFKWVFFGMGLLFLLFGGAALVTAIREICAQKRAFSSDNCVYAEFAGTVENMNVTVNGRHPYRAKLLYTDPYGEVHVFYSRDVMQDPAPALEGRMIAVYVDPENAENYYVDLEIGS